jgi:hypothetical protein
LRKAVGDAAVSFRAEAVLRLLFNVFGLVVIPLGGSLGWRLASMRFPAKSPLQSAWLGAYRAMSTAESAIHLGNPS